MKILNQHPQYKHLLRVLNSRFIVFSTDSYKGAANYYWVTSNSSDITLNIKNYVRRIENCYENTTRI